MTLVASVLKGTDNSFETTAEMFNGPRTDFGIEGVVGAITNTSGVSPATGAFAVNEAGTPDMTVDVTSGVAYVTATPTGQASQLIRVNSSATESVTINANSTGSTRYDWIYLTINATNADAPNSSGSNVATLTASRSTSASTDDGTPPTYGYPLAVVTVANGASSITDANITDKRTQSGYNPGAGSILPLHFNGLSTDTSTDWAWQSFTPTWTDFTLGNGTEAHYYTQIGKTVHGWGHVKWGSTTSQNLSISITAPVTPTSNWDTSLQYAIGNTRISDATGPTNYNGTAITNHNGSTWQIGFNVLGTSGSYGVNASFSGTVPFTWTTNDYFTYSYTYEAA